MSIPVEEQDTTLNIRRRGDFWEVFTSDSTFIAKLEKGVKNSPNDYILESISFIKGEEFGRKNMISFRGLRTKECNQ